MARVKSYPSQSAIDLIPYGSSASQFHLEISDESSPSTSSSLTCDYDFTFNDDLWNLVTDSSNSCNSGKLFEGSSDSDKPSPTAAAPDSSLLDFLEEVSYEELEGKNKTYDTSNNLSLFTNADSENHVCNASSLSALAENHLKSIGNNKPENDSGFDIDDDLADLLTSTCISDGKISKSFNSKSSSYFEISPESNTQADTNLSDLLGITSEESGTTNSESVVENNTFDGELKDLLQANNNMPTGSGISLAALAETHFVNNQSGNSIKSVDISFGSLELLDCFEASNSEIPEPINNFHFDQKSEKALDANISLLDILKAVNTNDENYISNYINDLNDDIKQESVIGVSLGEAENVDEQAPDIDLNDCIKTQDSVYCFDSNLPVILPVEGRNISNTDYTSPKCGISDSKMINNDDTRIGREEALEKQMNVKTTMNQSLFAKVLTCKSKPNKSLSEKVLKIKNEMLDQYCMLAEINTNEEKPQIINKVIDLSNQCMLPSVAGRLVFSSASCGVL